MSRSKGTPNRITSKTKALLTDLIIGETDRIQEALDEVFECNKKEYLQVMIRLLPYVIPKATEAPTKEPGERRPLSWFAENSLYPEPAQITS